MPPRSQLEISTSSVLRLVKEEASYHREAVEQAERIKKLENDKSEDENREYLLQQEVCLPTLSSVWGLRCPWICHWTTIASYC